MKSPVKSLIVRAGVRVSTAKRAALLTLVMAVLISPVSCSKKQAAAPLATSVMFNVTLPNDLDPNAEVYISGNVPSLGNWKADGAKMIRIGPSARLQVPVHADVSLEYKYTLGTWDGVEKKQNGDDQGNRMIEVKDSVALYDSVVRFGGRRTSLVTGTLKLHEKFESDILQNTRTLRVWLPPGYDAETDRKYPVLYMHDGQNLFDDLTSFAGEWHADETATKLIESRQIEPIIIVGIDNAGADRANEYTGIHDTIEKLGGESPEYAAFLVEEVMPFIAKTYRVDATPAKTGVAGSSLGGLVSLDIATKFPDQFGRIGACSPSVWWHDRWIINELKQHPQSVRGKRVWIDMGTAENDLPANSYLSVSDAKLLDATLKSLGADVSMDIIEGAKHNEAAWSARFDRVLLKLYATK